MAGNAHALKNSKLHPLCKVLEMKNFKPQKVADYMCLSYIFGIADTGMFICGVFESQSNPYRSLCILTKEFGVGFGIYDKSKVVRDYLRLIENNQDHAGQSASSFVNQALRKQLPCK